MASVRCNCGPKRPSATQAECRRVRAKKTGQPERCPSWPVRTRKSPSAAGLGLTSDQRAAGFRKLTIRGSKAPTMAANPPVPTLFSLPPIIV